MPGSRRELRGLRIALVVLGLVAVNTAYNGGVAATSLLGARASVQQFLGGKGSLRPESIEAALDGTIASAQAARAATSSPGIRLLSAIPRAGNDADLAIFASDTALEIAIFGQQVSERLQEVAQGGSLAGAFYRDGRVDLATVETTRALLGDASGLLRRIAARQSELSPPVLRATIKIASKTERMLADARAAARDATLLLAALPDLVGSNEPKRYFLAFQSPSEARGSGGIIGVYGILVADEGRLQLRHVAAVHELNEKLTRRADAPRWFANLYGDLLGLEEFRQANLGLHFPTVAQVLLDLYRNAKGSELDGVLTLDPIVLEQLTKATGPVRGPGWDVRVGPKNARRVLLHDIYLKFGRFRNKAQNQYLQGLIADLLTKFNAGRLDAIRLVEGLGKSTKWQHLKLFATDSRIQQALQATNLTGDFSAAGNNVQSVFHNNFVGSKIDYFLHRTIDTSVVLEPDGDATVRTEVLLDNRAPTEPSSLLIRPLRRKFENGHNRMTFHALLPKDARLQGISSGETQLTPIRGNELGYPVAWTVLDIGPMERTAVTIEYVIEDALEDGTFEMTLWPQARVRPDRFSFHLIPKGSVIQEVRPARRLQPDLSYVLTGRLFGPKTVRVRLSS